MSLGPSVEWLRYFQPIATERTPPPETFQVEVRVSARRVEPEGFVRLPRADAELRRRLAEAPQRLERATTAAWDSQIVQCVQHGLRIEDAAAPPQFLNDDASSRGLQLRIDEPELIAALCPFDINRDLVINSEDFTTGVYTGTPRERMIATVAATVAQTGGMVTARPQFARGVKTLFEIYPVLHAMDETLLLMTRARNNVLGSELALAAEDAARLVQGRMADPTLNSRGEKLTNHPLSRNVIETMNARLTEMFIDLHFYRDDTEEIPVVYGGILYYAAEFMPASLARAVERVRVRWLRTMSQLRKVGRVECYSSQWWGFEACPGVAELSFKWLSAEHPLLGVLEPGERNEVLFGRDVRSGAW